MTDLQDISNAKIRQEIEEFVENPDEIERNIQIFSRVRPLMQEIAVALIEGDDGTVDQLTKQALDDNIDALEIMDDGLIAAMGVVGIKFRDNFIFVPEVLACARAMKAGMAYIEPILSASGVEPLATVIMGTVKGDLHDIGKNLCIMMLRGSGFNVVDLGVDTSDDEFIDAVEEHSAPSVFSDTPLPYDFSESRTALIFEVGRELTGNMAEFVVNNEFLFSSKIGKKGKIKILKRSSEGKRFTRFVDTGRDLEIFLKSRNS